ncbi:MAG: GNAT family N-acetyltransferase [Dehalococcoidia bacterium]|nr:MAG: GNAT family N-acetyltransferase [Dehalococcoidia bacterium]
MTIHAAFQLERLSKAELKAERSALVAVYFSAYRDLPHYAYHSRNEVEDYLSWLHRGDRRGFYVVRVGKEIVAWMSVHDSWRGWRGDQPEAQGELQELVVARPYQGMGLGRRLVALAIQHTARAGRRRIGLYVGEQNEPARRLYERFGFRVESQWNIWLRMQRPVDPVVDQQLEGLGDNL